MAKQVYAALSDKKHSLPHPLKSGLMFSAEGEFVDAENPAWMQLFNDGSIIEIDPPADDNETTKQPAKGKR